MRQKGNGSAQSFLHGAMILTGGIILVKIIGALFKAPLTWVIGEDGMGYYNTAYMLYSPLYSLATAGLPIAVSRLTAESSALGRKRDVREWYRVSIPVFTLMGGAGTLLMALGAPLYAKWIGNLRALPCMAVLAPAILFSCLTAIYRGSYEGLRNMYPTALSELIEAVGKLALGLVPAHWVMQEALREFSLSGSVWGVPAPSEAYARSLASPLAAAGAALGVTTASLASFLVLAGYRKRRGDGIAEEELSRAPVPAPRAALRRRLLKTALPVGAGAVAVNLSGLLDAAFLQTRLRGVMERAPGALLAQYPSMIPEEILAENTVPNFLYGCYSMALTLFLAVPAITQAFGISALPTVTAAWARGGRERLRRSIEMVLRVSAFVSIPAGLGLSVLAEPLTRLVFGDRPSSPITARVLAVLGIAAVFASLSTPINSMLQAMGRADLPVKLLLCGLTGKAAIHFYCSGIPEINLLGAAAGTLACYGFVTVCGLVLLRRVSGVSPRAGAALCKPFAASVLCAAAARGGYALLTQAVPDRAATLLAVFFAAVVYAFSLLLLRAIPKDDLLMLPKGQKIAKILEKYGRMG